MTSSEGSGSDGAVPRIGGPKRSLKGPLALILAAALIVIAVFILYQSGYLTPSPQPPGGNETWQAWGMSIQHPAGLTAHYKGVRDALATNDSGAVFWYWNNGNTGMSLMWANATSLNYQAFFVGFYQQLLTMASNVTVVDHGNVTMVGSVWQYQTYRYIINGTSTYQSHVLNYYNATGRLYDLSYIDISPTTLASLMAYGQSFIG